MQNSRNRAPKAQVISETPVLEPVKQSIVTATPVVVVRNRPSGVARPKAVVRTETATPRVTPTFQTVDDNVQAKKDVQLSFRVEIMFSKNEVKEIEKIIALIQSMKDKLKEHISEDFQDVFIGQTKIDKI